jgi:F5/8 type C domain/Glycosyl hydrolase family 26
VKIGWWSRLAPTALMCIATAQAQDPFPAIGFYVGDPTPTKAADAYQSFVETVNQIPNSTSLFIDYREPIWSAGAHDPKWRNNAYWAAENLATLASAEYLNRVDESGEPDFIPVVSVGLTDDPTAFQLHLAPDHPQYGVYSEPAAVAMMRDIAHGKYDVEDPGNGRRRVWPAILDAFRDKGFRKIYLRIGWEQNGNWYGWQVRSEATRSAYIAAWRHVADLAHRYAIAYGMTIETVWSPTASYTNYGISEEESYPGDAYVDIIAPTLYSPVWNPTRSADRTGYYDWSTQQTVTLAAWLANPVNRRHLWDHPGADYWNPTRGWGLPAAIELARSRGKRFGLAEVGTGNAGVTTRGGGPVDEGEFPLYLAEHLAPALAAGLQVEFVDIWAEASGADGLNFLSGERPLEAAAWRDFGAVMGAAAARRNVAADKPAYASSIAGSAGAAANAVDGELATRWRSAVGAAKQWIFVDLGRRFTISKVRLEWDAAYASSYHIQTSIDGLTWTNIYATTSANGGIDEVAGLSGSGRYVRVFVTAPASTLAQYALRELKVYP